MAGTASAPGVRVVAASTRSAGSSGGLEPHTVARLARKLAGPPKRAFAAERLDDVRGSRAVCRRGGPDHAHRLVRQGLPNDQHRDLPRTSCLPSMHSARGADAAKPSHRPRSPAHFEADHALTDAQHDGRAAGGHAAATDVAMGQGMGFERSAISGAAQRSASWRTSSTRWRPRVPGGAASYVRAPWVSSSLRRWRRTRCPTVRWFGPELRDAIDLLSALAVGVDAEETAPALVDAAREVLAELAGLLGCAPPISLVDDPSFPSFAGWPMRSSAFASPARWGSMCWRARRSGPCLPRARARCGGR